MGWKKIWLLKISGLEIGGINNFQGRSVGKPKASLLKKLPHRPIAWPSATEGKRVSKTSQKLSFFCGKEIKQ